MFSMKTSMMSRPLSSGKKSNKVIASHSKNLRASILQAEHPQSAEEQKAQLKIMSSVQKLLSTSIQIITEDFLCALQKIFKELSLNQLPLKRKG